MSQYSGDADAVLEGSDTDDDDDGIEVLSPSQGRIKQRTPRQPSPYYPRTHRVAQIPDTDENETGSDEDIERPQTARANAKEISKDNDDRQPDLELRRSSGRAANRVPVNYNLKYVPIPPVLMIPQDLKLIRLEGFIRTMTRRVVLPHTRLPRAKAVPP